VGQLVAAPRVVKGTGRVLWSGKVIFLEVHLWGVGALSSITEGVSNIDDVCAMHEAVYDGVCDGSISQGHGPFLEADAGGDDKGEFFMACGD
jgi:hypothetical protein